MLAFVYILHGNRVLNSIEGLYIRRVTNFNSFARVLNPKGEM